MAGDFWVLLGADYSGKSSVLSRVASRTGWTTVSYDDDLLGEEYSLISRLRGDYLGEALCGWRKQFSTDFVVSILQTAVVFLRDRALSECGSGPVLVDSYYYKILAKCQLFGLVNDRLFDWWRSFPAPRGVMFIDVAPELAWQRAAGGTSLNAFEHYGDRPTREAFIRFQNDLRGLMLAETQELPRRVVGPHANLDELVGQVETTVRRDHGDRRDG